MPLSAAEVDPRSGYCAATRTFHSIRPPLPLPPADLPLSFPAFMFSLLPAALPSRPALVDAATGEAVPFPAFLSRVRALAAALRARLGVSRGDVAFVLAPPGVHVPVLYYALMAVGAVVSPANPALTAGEISGLIALSGPSVAFAVKATAGKLPPDLNTVLLDSARFLSFFHEARDEDGAAAGTDVVTHQSDPAAILYSSGTTGRAKAVVLTHRNLMASDATRAAATAEGYGLTETTSGFCRAVGEAESAQIGSVGRLSWGAQAKIVHPETGVALPPGVPGELWVRGPFVMKGYAGDEDSTSKIMDSEGWLRTGDLCYIDKYGIVFVVDRLKELIKYKGYQVPPAELESLLQTHPDIDEAAVVSYPDDQAGELPVAFIVSSSGSILHEAQIKEFVAKRVVHYKQIHHIFFVNSIPKNAAGKILRKDLAKLTLQHIQSKL
ncbi:hypothetical protein PVAP13_8KG156500 [Panicum virgatum]|uniref:4-coumarate--CoA ligase n=1 Tax=Panicum virgatum TaxID=38727 RepID=A0A8T0PGY2_PANVG|nr:hypothetical protein PVAP13_8KG156500 [Panicum virgatum]